MNLRRQFLRFDDRLASAGVPPLTSWWREGIGAWLDAYEHGRVLELWGCCGRGAAKSTALYKIALFFTLFGDFDVPPGERHFAVVLSRLKEEASKGIAIISQWLTLLGVAHSPSGDVIELDAQPRGIRVVAASVAAATGWRAFFVGKDERSKWPTAGVEEREADEIDTSAAAMTATHPLAPVVSFGSAWGQFGAFYEAITGGSDERRHVLGPAATWIAAPHVREEDLRRKERDARRFAREYECIFQGSGAGAFDPDAIAACFAEREPLPPSIFAAAPTFIIDASSGRSDAWTWARVRWLVPASVRYKMTRRYSHMVGWWWDYDLDADGKYIELPPEKVIPPTVRFDYVAGVEGKFWQNTTAEKIVATIADDFAASGGVRVVGDQREAYALAALFSRHGIPFASLAWTAANKPAAVDTVRRWMRDGQLILPRERVASKGTETQPHAKLRRELLEFEERIAPSGQLTFGARGQRHDDYVALLITAALADQNGLLSSSPSRVVVRRDLTNLPTR